MKETENGTTAVESGAKPRLKDRMAIKVISAAVGVALYIAGFFRAAGSYGWSTMSLWFWPAGLAIAFLVARTALEERNPAQGAAGIRSVYPYSVVPAAARRMVRRSPRD